MTTHHRARRAPRTVLEQTIWDSNQTFEEYAEYAEQFARDHHEPATLGVRHLERLAAGRRGDGRPLGPVRPATARLLEHMIKLPIAVILGPPKPEHDDEPEAELRQRLTAARRIDPALLKLFADQLNAIRRLDRQLGAATTYREITIKTEQLTQLHTHSLTPTIRAQIASLQADAYALAAWTALDLGDYANSWNHHEKAKTAARDANSQPLTAYTTAQQAVILIDLGETENAAQQLTHARTLATNDAPPLLRTWLAAAHGEGLAAAGHRDNALRAFGDADTLMPSDPADPNFPFIFLGPAHLARWRGHALAELGDHHATSILAQALNDLDPTFTRAQAALHTDLATIHTKHGNNEQARQYHQNAWRLATHIGSTRQKTRLRKLSWRIGTGLADKAL
jgi:tetratricopeptide (TPR) repeat protein